MSDDADIPAWMKEIYVEDQDDAQQLPSSELDAQIMQSAKAELTKHQAQEVPKRRMLALGSPWLSGVASAAVVVLTVSLVIMAPPEQGDDEVYLRHAPEASSTEISEIAPEPSPHPNKRAQPRSPSSAFNNRLKSNASSNLLAPKVPANRQVEPAEGAVPQSMMKDAPSAASLSADRLATDTQSGFSNDNKLLETELVLDEVSKVSHPDCSADYEIPAGAVGIKFQEEGASYELDGQVIKVTCVDGKWQRTARSP